MFNSKFYICIFAVLSAVKPLVVVNRHYDTFIKLLLLNDVSGAGSLISKLFSEGWYDIVGHIISEGWADGFFIIDKTSLKTSGSNDNFLFESFKIGSSGSFCTVEVVDGVNYYTTVYYISNFCKFAEVCDLSVHKFLGCYTGIVLGKF